MNDLIPAEDAKKVPEWMVLTPESVTVKFSVPSTLNSIECDSITLRSPSLKDVRSSMQAHPKDGDAADLMLFSSLAQCGPADLEGLKVKDYNRVHAAYFRLVSE